MITLANRHSVTNTLQRLLSAAEYFSAYELVRSASTYQTSDELRGWAEMKASEFDEQFKILAKDLGYSVQKIGEPTDLLENLKSVVGDHDDYGSVSLASIGHARAAIAKWEGRSDAL